MNVRVYKTLLSTEADAAASILLNGPVALYSIIEGPVRINLETDRDKYTRILCFYYILAK